MSVSIIKYNAGNIFSVENALHRLGVDCEVTNSPETIRRSSHVIFPGQGEAGTTMSYLRHTGLDQLILSLTQPVLGICIGMQLMCRYSEEDNTSCLGIFDVDIMRFRPERHSDKVPQMGWNELHGMKSPLFKDVPEGSYAYFIHSFYAPLCDATISKTDYILPYSSSLQKGNFFATQFHPEKSGSIGEQILKNFLTI